MRRRFGDLLLSVAALGILLTVLMASDTRVRDMVSHRMNAGATSQVVSAGGQMHDLMTAIFDAVRYQAEMHTALTLFVIAATVLTVFMVRT